MKGSGFLCESKKCQVCTYSCRIELAPLRRLPRHQRIRAIDAKDLHNSTKSWACVMRMSWGGDVGNTAYTRIRVMHQRSCGWPRWLRPSWRVEGSSFWPKATVFSFTYRRARCPCLQVPTAHVVKLATLLLLLEESDTVREGRMAVKTLSLEHPANPHRQKKLTNQPAEATSTPRVLNAERPSTTAPFQWAVACPLSHQPTGTIKRASLIPGAIRNSSERLKDLPVILRRQRLLSLYFQVVFPSKHGVRSFRGETTVDTRRNQEHTFRFSYQ